MAWGVLSLAGLWADCALYSAPSFCILWRFGYIYSHILPLCALFLHFFACFSLCPLSTCTFLYVILPPTTHLVTLSLKCILVWIVILWRNADHCPTSIFFSLQTARGHIFLDTAWMTESANPSVLPREDLAKTWDLLHLPEPSSSSSSCRGELSPSKILSLTLLR